MKNQINSVQNLLNSCISIEKVVYESDSLGIFSYLETNRIGNSAQKDDVSFSPQERARFDKRVQVLEKSIRENEFDKNRPCLVAIFDDKLYLVDGQTRAQAAVNVGAKFYFEIVDKDFKDIKELTKYVLSLNTDQTPWNATDRFKSYLRLNDRQDVLNIFADIRRTYGKMQKDACIFELWYGQGAAKRSAFKGDVFLRPEPTEDQKSRIFNALETRQRIYEINVERTEKGKKGYNSWIEGEKFVAAFRNLFMYYDIKEKHIENMLQNYKSNNFEYPQKESLKSPEFCTNFLINLINNGLIGTRLAEYSEQKKIVNCERAKTPKRKKVNLNAKILITID